MSATARATSNNSTRTRDQGRVLLVTDEPIGGVPHMLPKWGSFDRLTDEIRRAHGRELNGVLPA